MYSFSPSEEQAMLVDAVRRYAENDVRPAAHEADEAKELPRPLIERGWELGLLQASVPEAYGGFGERSVLTSALAAEELAWGDLSLALAVMIPSGFAVPLMVSGTEMQKETWLTRIANGPWEPYVAAFTEPRFDFYPQEMETRARPNGGGYLLTGEKTQVPFADEAEAFLVFADCDGDIEGFIVPAGSEGLEIGEREKLLGIHALPTHSLRLNDVAVAEEGRLSAGDSAGTDSLLAASQVATAALGVGISRGAYEYALDYAKDREAFGTPIAQKQSIAFMLAEMATDIEAIRLLVWQAAWKLDHGKPDASEAAYLALTGAADMTMMVTDRAVQILGGHGYIREHPVERWMRNGRGLPAFVGMVMA